MSYIGNNPPTGTAGETSEVNTPNIAAGAVTTTRLADGAVTTIKITDSNITSAKIADNAVTTAKILDSNVTTAKIADSNVTTVKIADSNVTANKLGANAVTTAKLADNAVTGVKIADAIITYAKFATAALATASDIINSVGSKIVTAAQFKLGLRGLESYTFLAERNASTSASLDFTSLITSEFDHYVFEIVDIIPVASSILQCWFSGDNGTTWNITSGDYGRIGINTYSGSSSNGNISTSTAASIELTLAVGIQAGAAINGTTKLYNPLSNGKTKFMNFKIAFLTSEDYVLFDGTGVRKSSLAPVNAVRFIMSTGNIASGTIRMYGIRKT